MNDDMDRMVDIATGQHGAITVGQLGRAGLSSDQLRSRIQRGLLQRVGTRVLRSPFVDATPLAELAALVLDCGEGAVASGPTAAALHGFDGFLLAPPFDVTIPRGRLVRRDPHRIHTTQDLAPIDRTRVHGVPTMTAARDLIDLARTTKPRRLTIALDSALRDRATTEEMLHERIVDLRSSGRYGIPKLLAVIEGIEVTRGGHSFLERRFLELCASSGLPRPLTQQVLARARHRIVRVDFEFPGTPVIVEVLGYRWHRGSREQLARDAARINALVLSGRLPMQFTYDHLVGEPDWVIEQVTQVLHPFA